MNNVRFGQLEKMDEETMEVLHSFAQISFNDSEAGESLVFEKLKNMYSDKTALEQCIEYISGKVSVNIDGITYYNRNSDYIINNFKIAEKFKNRLSPEIIFSILSKSYTSGIPVAEEDMAAIETFVKQTNYLYRENLKKLDQDILKLEAKTIKNLVNPYELKSILKDIKAEKRKNISKINQEVLDGKLKDSAQNSLF